MTTPDPRLLHRPEARPFKIEDLVTAIIAGRIWIPAFQRPLRWGEKDALALIDSIDRGYPIGTLLLWRRRSRGASIQIGTMCFDASGGGDQLAVVDGQQRLIWLMQMLYAGTSPSGRDFVYDLASGRFAVLGRGERPTASQAPTDRLVDSARLMAWVFETAEQLTAEQRTALFELGKRVRDYPLPGYVIDGDEATVREVFRRCNTTGKALDEADVFDAVHGLWDEAGDRPLASLREVAIQLASLDFGPIEEDTVARVVKALAGLDLGRPLDVKGLQDPHDLVRRAHDALVKAVDFIRVDAGITHIAVLAYRLPLVTLGVFFDAHPAPSYRSRELLARWLWRGAVSERHQGTTATAREALTAARSPSESLGVQGLLQSVGRDPARSPDVRAPFNFRTARSKLITVLMLEQGPRRLDHPDYEELGPNDLFHREPRDARHATRWPRLVAPERGRAGTDIRVSAANQLLHPPISQERLRAALRAAPAEVLETHFLTEEDAARLALGDLDALERRAQRMAQAVEARIALRAQWSAPDRPEIRSLLLEEDDAA